MRLIRLSANHESFKTVNFRPSGLTLIVGTQSKGGKTYNGVGKSLIIQLVHFCLGASRNSQFEEKIPQWEFTLEFEVLGARHKVSRNTSRQSKVLLDNAEQSVSSFTQWMEERVFTVPEDVAGLSFRALLPKFLRRGQAEYVDPRKTGERTDYEIVLRNAFLLGLEVHLVARKAEIRDEIKRISTLRGNFKNDQLLRDFYLGGKDAGIHLNHLEQKIKKLENDKSGFVIAENYHELREEADRLAERIANETNAAFLTRSTIENIEKSIRGQPDLPVSRLRHLYGELTEAFKAESLKRLEEVSDFHQRMLANRIARLSGEKLRLLATLNALEASLKPLQIQLDQRLKALGEARALDQYTAVVGEISNLRSQADKLRDYQNIERQYTDQEAVLKVQLSEEVIATNVYLDETKSERESQLGIFNEFVSSFYPDKVAGISVHNNAGDNRLRYDLAVHVENDSSDGINEVRIFCYDLTLLALKKGHKIAFLFHDSRLFANMDVRQRAALFKLANKVTSELGCQYIATLNPDFISGMEAEFSAQEFKKVIKDNIVLELRDDSPSGKLLGIDVDMQYE